MAFEIRLFEKFAMQAELQPESKDGYGWTDLFELGRALNISKEITHEYAIYLRDEGWAVVEFHAEPRFRITYEGHRAINSLRRPKWQRWIDRHSILVNVFWMTATAIISGIISSVITYHLLK
jgi:hypothetical protein